MNEPCEMRVPTVMSMLTKSMIVASMRCENSCADGEYSIASGAWK